MSTECVVEDSSMVLVEVLDDLIEDAILGFTFEIHRNIKSGVVFKDNEPSPTNTKQPVQREKDKLIECVCPVCKLSFGANYFAPHLAKCMGMGGRRIARPTRRAAKIESNNDSVSNENIPPVARRIKKRDNNLATVSVDSINNVANVNVSNDLTEPVAQPNLPSPMNQLENLSL